MMGYGTLASLPMLRDARSRRISSFDTSGRNADFWVFEPGDVKTLGEIEGPGCIKHIWMTIGSREHAFPRRIVLRAWWDSEDEPSIEVPIGDFFGLGHGIRKNFTSLPLTMSPQDGKGFNCYWPMPFAERARFEVQSECEERFNLYFYLDHELYDEAPHDVGYLHAQWRRQNPTDGWVPEEGLSREEIIRRRGEIENLDGAGNYVILEAEGRGHYVGCHLDIDCFAREKNDWYGEGDDMIFIDGEPWPPSMHGTGTEDYFNTAYCPRQEFNAPYHGIILYSGTEQWPFKGKNSLYRYHIEDPIHFRKSIHVSIEHGHGNNLSNDYSSTAYWYQTEPHKPFPELLPVAERLPRPDEPQYEPFAK